MEIIATKLEGCYIIKPDVYEDDRGYFAETYNLDKFRERGINNIFIQDNESLSKKVGIIRGIHLQNEPFSQAKLVSCVQGSVFDVAVDLRKDSPTYKRWIGVELTPENHLQLLIPRGFGHAFQTLKENTIFHYKVDNPYSKNDERAIIYNDPDIGVIWPIKHPSLSEKDLDAKVLKKVDIRL
ncbi:MAG: dTDP-4-dehydrorhamnose 3,5-epimerase [Bacilli bacterium]|nr:dTDP-4-dehydrorhamnose 3,5-epimerase [Bacilli bacterium]